MALYNEDLPMPSAADYQVAPATQVHTTQMEVGSDRVRRRTSTRMDTVNVQWVFTDEQFQTFRGWYDADAGGGAEWFTGLALPLGDGGDTSADFRFLAPWVAEQLTPDAWMVRAQLEVSNP